MNGGKVENVQWVFRILVVAILALACGCMLGAFVLLIEEAHNSRRRHKRVMDAIDAIQKGGAAHVDSEAKSED